MALAGLVGFAGSADAAVVSVGTLSALNTATNAGCVTGSTVTLTAAISSPATDVTVNCSLTLDLNGKALAVRSVIINSGKVLTVQDSSAGALGTLVANASAAAIPGIRTTAATLVVLGGTVTATGGTLSAGIGGLSGAAGGTVTLTSGTVTATGGSNAAGIGGGSNAAGGAVVIGANANVTATGGFTAVGAGLGNGSPATVLAFGGLEVNGILRIPSGFLRIPDSSAINEIRNQPTGQILGTTADPTVGAQITGPGSIENTGLITLSTSLVTGGAPAAVVKKNHSKVTFDTQGGSAAPAPVTVFAGTFTAGARVFPANPTKVGFSFAGWRTAAAGGGTPFTVTSTLPGTSDGTAPVPVTAYASWTAVAGVTWATPSPIVYGTTLASSLNAVAPAGATGTITYAEGAGAVTGTSVLGAGSHTLVATFTPSGASALTYPVSTATVTLVVTAAPVTFTVTGSQTFGGTPTFAATPDVAGVTATGVGCTQVTAGGGTTISPTLATAGSPYTLASATCSGTVSPNYAATYVGSTFTVSKQAVTFTVSGSQTYGGTPTFTSTSSVPGATATGVTCTQVTAGGGTTITPTLAVAGSPYVLATCSGSTSSDYAPTFTGGTFTVAPQPVTFTVTGSQTYGGTPSFVATPSVPGATALLVACTKVTSGATISPALAVAGSPYTIDGSTCSATVSSNYAPSYTGSTFTVAKQPVTFTVSGSQTYGSTPVFSATPDVSGATASATCTQVIVGEGTATISPTLPVTGSPYTLVTSSCSGTTSSDYDPTFVGGEFTVPKQPVTITVDGSQTYNGTPTFTASSDVADAADTAVVSCTQVLEGGTPTTITPTLAVDGSPYALVTSSCSGSTSENYAPTFVGGSFTVAPQAVTFTVSGSQTYNGTPTFTATPDVPGATALLVTCTKVADDGGIAITPTLPVAGSPYTLADCSGSTSSNYTPTFNGSVFSVTPQPVTFTVTGSQTYNGSPSFSSTADVVGATATGVTCTSVTAGGGTPITPTLAVAGSPYTLADCSGTTSSNYDPTFTGGAFTVTPQPVTFTVTGSQTFNGTPSFSSTSNVFGATATGVACTKVTAGGGTTITPTLAFDGSPYTLLSSSCTGTVSSNYEPTYDGSTFTVYKQPVTFTVTGQQTFGTNNRSFVAASSVIGATALPVACTRVTAGGAAGTVITSSLAVASYTLKSDSCGGTVSTNYAPTYVGSTFKVLYACSDGLDNDGNGEADYPRDLGCTSANDATEAAEANCMVVGLFGTGGADTFNGTAAGEKYSGGDGADTINGVGGADCLYGENGGDRMNGGTGNDVLYGGLGGDFVYGGDGDDAIEGGESADFLYGEAGNDRIVSVGGGADQVDCGAGTADVAIVDKVDIVKNCETKTVLAAPAP